MNKIQSKGRRLVLLFAVVCVSVCGNSCLFAAGSKDMQGILQVAFRMANERPQVLWGFELTDGLKVEIDTSVFGGDLRKIPLEDFAKEVVRQTDYQVDVNGSEVTVRPKINAEEYTFPVSVRMAKLSGKRSGGEINAKEVISLIGFDDKSFKLFDATTSADLGSVMIGGVGGNEVKTLADWLFQIAKNARVRMWVLQLVETSAGNEVVRPPRVAKAGTVQFLN